MAKPHTFFGKLLATIGSIFGSVLRGAAKTFKNLTPEQQASLQHGSGIMALITQELDKTPAELRDLILAKFPDLDLAKLETGLFEIAKAFNLNPEINNLEDIIQKLKDYLASLHGTVWEGITHSAALLLSVLIAPAGTKIVAFSSLIEYVYLTFFKKKDG